MNPNFLIIFTLVAVFSMPLKAQNPISENDPDRLFREGIELLDRQKYSAARETFEEYLATADNNLKTIDAQYYLAFASLSLYNPDGEAKLEDFTKKYANHPKSVLAYYELGNFYFRDQKYNAAIENFEKTETTNLTREQVNTRNFKLAYSYFSRQKFEEALTYFNQVKAGSGIYRNAANYYAGYIAYQNKQYEQALTDLKNAEQDESYANIVPYMIANIYYEQGKYDELIRYGKSMQESSSKSRLKNEADIMLLVGEAYYKKQDYKNAATYLEAYAADRIPANDVMYRLAYAQYQNGETQKAIDNFKRIAAEDNLIGQYASYYLGILYVDQKNSNFAVTALERASKLSYDQEIREQALFNLGKVYFSSADYAQTITALSKFVNTYRSSKYMAEANDLLSQAYLNTKDFDVAIDFIENLPQKSEKIRQAYQQVTYFKGTEEFNKSNFPRAVQLFEKSLKYSENRDFVVAANFWMGEAYSIGKKYDEAITAYNKVFTSAPTAASGSQTALYQLKAHYGVGYAYYNTKQYTDAQNHFRDYLDELAGQRKQLYSEDALLRLADCYYVNKQYSQAITSYDKAIRENNPDKAYAYYQKGIVLGIQGKTEEAKSNLDIVIDRYADSRYYDDAIFQKAQQNFEEGNYQAAIAGFTNIINQQSESNLVPYALLRRAIANSNLKNYDNTIKDYKQILDNYISHAVANSALLGLQAATSQTEGNTNDFSSYLARYKQANPDDKDLSNIEFESAKSLYFSQKYSQAINALKAYIDAYPESANAEEAKYYIAESHYRNDNLSSALEYYYQIADEGKSDRVGRATQRIAELEFMLLNYAKAVTYFKKLERLAQNKREQYNAWAGQMESYFELGKKQTALLDSTDKYAQLILERGSVAANASNEAQLYLGKTAYLRGDNEQAIDHFLKTLNAAKDESGAEAQYLMAEIQNKQEQYKQSIETLYDLNKNFSLYEYWLGKSFLLIADNYVALDEYFQAKATLNSVIEKSPLKEIVDQAKSKLSTLEQKELEQKEQQRIEDSIKIEQENQLEPVGTPNSNSSINE